MNQNEVHYFSGEELQFYDATTLPVKYLLKSLFVKFRRKLWGKLTDRNARMVWTVTEVSDAIGPADNVRNYLERQTVRSLLSEVAREQTVASACEVGCGYGRLIMVLKEFSSKVVGFEREPHLVSIAHSVLPDVEFCQCDSLDQINKMGKGEFDVVMTCTVLQHLTDDFCQKVLQEIKQLAPKGHVLLIEKTEAINVSQNVSEGRSFLSRARTVETYQKWMEPYALVKTTSRVLERTYDNKSPGTCMLFKSPALSQPK